MIEIHKIKILEHFATDILVGGKTFEVRNNDRNFKKGDIVQFQAISGKDGSPVSHPINSRSYRIGYVLRAEDFPAGLKEGYAVFAISAGNHDDDCWPMAAKG